MATESAFLPINRTKTLESASLMQLLACKGQINSTDSHKCRCVLDKHSLCIFVLPAITSREAGVCSYVRAYVSISIRALHTNRHRNTNHATTVLHCILTCVRTLSAPACEEASGDWLPLNGGRKLRCLFLFLTSIPLAISQPNKAYGYLDATLNELKHMQWERKSQRWSYVRTQLPPAHRISAISAQRT